MNDPVLFSNNCNAVARAERFLSKYKPLFKWSDSEDILEIGCSNGLVTKNVLYPFVRDHLRHLIAADIFEPAIKAAKETNDISNLSFQVMDITDEEECEKYVGKFDHIFAFNLFQLVHRPDLWSKNIYKMLKRNGQIFTSICMHTNLVTWVTAAQKEDKSKPWSKYIEDLPDLCYDFGPEPVEAIRKIFTDAGFAVIVLDLQTVPVVSNDVQQMKNIAISTASFLRHIPEGLREEYLQDYMEKFFQYVTSEPDGKYYFPVEFVTAMVTKS